MSLENNPLNKSPNELEEAVKIETAEEKMWQRINAMVERLNGEGYAITAEQRDNTFAIIYPDRSEEHFMKFNPFPVSDTTGAVDDIVVVMERAIKNSGRCAPPVSKASSTTPPME